MTGTGAQANKLTATRFGYAKNGRAVVYILGEAWDFNAACPNDNYNIIFAKEFRYDSARERYMNRSLNPSLLMAGQYVATSSTWSDYDDDDIHSDFTVADGPPATTAQYEPGLWNTEGGAARYLHADHMGTLRLTTSSSGIPGTLRSFTAFGERLSATQDRFGYVGAHGYQADSQIPLLHVGARYYDPTAGRFTQRDRIGIRGDANVYGYVIGLPTLFIDPNGTDEVVPPYYVLGGGRVVGEVAGVIGDLVKSGLIAGAAVGSAAVGTRIAMDAAERAAKAKELKAKKDKLDKYIRDQKIRRRDHTDPAKDEILDRLINSN